MISSPAEQTTVHIYLSVSRGIWRSWPAAPSWSSSCWSSLSHCGHLQVILYICRSLCTFVGHSVHLQVIVYILRHFIHPQALRTSTIHMSFCQFTSSLFAGHCVLYNVHPQALCSSTGHCVHPQNSVFVLRPSCTSAGPIVHPMIVIFLNLLSPHYFLSTFEPLLHLKQKRKHLRNVLL